MHTPRWTKITGGSGDREKDERAEDEMPFFDPGARFAAEEDDRGSPWTIEAVDGEGDEITEVRTFLSHAQNISL